MPADRSPIAGIDHVQITIPVGAEAAARAFYCALLGLPEIPKPDSLQGRGGFWVLVGDLPLHIGTEPVWDRSLTKAHIAFVVTDVDAWRHTVTASGYIVIESIPIPGRDRFETHDPFGNRLEFISRN
ncbi:MAG TPA: VOC family protein [Thermomicrobiales bacterium]|nr:VOC family protein [Thermomicrobiales bacterium]